MNMENLEPLTVELTLHPGTDVPPARLAQMTAGFQLKLKKIQGIRDVRLARTRPLPDDAKSADPVTLGALMVTMAGTSVIPKLIDAVKAYFTQQSVTKITINGNTLETQNLSQSQIDALVKH